MTDYSEFGWEIWWSGDTIFGAIWIIERRRWNGQWEFRKVKLPPPPYSAKIALANGDYVQ